MRNYLKRVCTSFLLSILYILFSFFSGMADNSEDSATQPTDDEALFEMELDELLDITVSTASKSEEKLSDAPGVLSVITRDELNRFGGSSLKEALLRVPSIMMGANYMTDRSMITLRGDHVLSKSGHILFLINGRPIREVLEGGLISDVLESFPLNAVNHIEVIRGPGSVLYGTNAFSGVVNIITKENSSVVNSGINVSGGDEAFVISGHAGVKDNDFSFFASMRYGEKKPWHCNWQAVGVDGNTYSKRITIPDKGPGAYVGINYKNCNVMYSYTKWETFYGIAGQMSPLPADGIVDWNRHFASAGWMQPIGNKWSMDFGFTYTGTNLHVSSAPGITRNTNEFLWELSNIVSPIENLNIVFGAAVSYLTGFEYVMMPNPVGKYYVVDTSGYSVGIYTQADWRFIDQIKIIAGIQGNKVEDVDFDVVARVGIIIDPITQLNVKLLYSQAFRAPFLHELYLNHPALKGNKDLVPEKVHTVDLGANVKFGKVQAGINGFFSKQVDIIIQDRTDPNTIAFYNNFGEITFLGLECEARYYIIPEIYLLASMLLQSNKDQDDNENVAPSPNLCGKGGISYKADNGISVSLFNSYQGKPDDKYKSVINESPDSFHLLTIFCSYDINKRIKSDKVNKFDLYLRAENVLDKEIWLTDWNLSLGKSLPAKRGRIISGGMNIEF